MLPCVPQQAVVDLPGGNQAVYVLNEKDLTVGQRIVTTKEVYEGWIPVVKGVKENEKIVISGVSKLRQGAKVALMKETANDDLDPNYKPALEN